MFNETKILGPLKTGSQSPLDGKNYFKNLDDSKNVLNNRPLEWYKYMTAIDLSTGTEYLWVESVQGIIQGGYTYPNNISSFGINYSNKTFNFILKPSKNYRKYKCFSSSVDQGLFVPNTLDIENIENIIFNNIDLNGTDNLDYFKIFE